MKNKSAILSCRIAAICILAVSLHVTNPAHAALTNVSVVDFAFSPRAVTIAVNDQVRWSWTGVAPHSSTSDTGLWDSGVNDMGSTFTNTFPAAGNFPSHSTVHGS